MINKEKHEFYITYVFSIKDEAYLQNVRNTFNNYTRYIRLKSYSDDNYFSNEMVGYPSEKMSIREMMMRKGVKADERKSFEEIVYLNDFEHPLNPDDAGDLFLPLEMVRLAPSAVNKQPWRMLIQNHFVHFYLERSKNFGGGKIDMQKIDLGIALCHFEIMANDLGISTELIIEKPDVYAKKELDYIASYKLNG